MAFRTVCHAVLRTLTSQSDADSIAREMIKDPGHQVLGEMDVNPVNVKVEDQKPLHDIGLAMETGEAKTPLYLIHGERILKNTASSRRDLHLPALEKTLKRCRRHSSHQ